MRTTSRNIRIESISAQSLLPFAEAHLTAARPQPMAAITRHRALAHSLNPHAAAGDIGLHVAYAGSTCVGYLGLLPAYVTNGCQRHKVSFMSTFYVVPEYRNRRVAFALLTASIRLNTDLIVTGYTPEAGSLYQALGFADLGHVDYLALRAPDRGVATRSHWLACRAMVADAKPAMVARVDQVPSIVDRRFPGEKLHFCRDASVLNWMLRYPWVREKIPETHPPYHFSDVRPVFRQLALRIDDRDGASGILLVSFSGRTQHRVVRMLDCYAPTEAMYAIFFYVVCTCAARFLADEVMLPCDIQPELMRHGPTGEMVTWMRRDYLCHRPSDGRSAIPSDVRRLQLSYCDGDTAFT
jgi:GNAT superfamily N-acetyltransferase